MRPARRTAWWRAERAGDGARTLKLRVVAEGEKTHTQWALLKAHDCDEFQGFLISRPVDACAFARLPELRRGRLEAPAKA